MLLFSHKIISENTNAKAYVVIFYINIFVIVEYGLGNEVSILGDVYSYGILLLEMFTGRRPTDSKFGDELSLHKYVQMALPERVINIADQQLLSNDGDGKGISNSVKVGDARIVCITSVLQIGIACSNEIGRAHV